MIKEMIEAGGKAFLIPAVLFVLVTYIAKGLFGLHGRRSQHRKEFLELWDTHRSQDDLWLEVAVRHLCGTYLPAHVIRLVLVRRERAQGIFDLAELWPLLVFDPDSLTITWRHSRHASLQKLRFGRMMMIGGYFACAVVAVVSGIAAAIYGPTTVNGWIYGTNAVVFGFLAIICLLRDDTLKIAAGVGDYWVNHINRAAEPVKQPPEHPNASSVLR